MSLNRTTLCLLLVTTTALCTGCDPDDTSLGDLPDDEGSATGGQDAGSGGQSAGAGVGGASTGDPTILAEDGPIEAVRVFEQDAYYVKWTPPSSGAASHGIWRVTTQVMPTDPLPTPELVAELPVVGNSAVFEIGFDVDATHVYFVDNESDGIPGPQTREILRFPISGGAMETVAQETAGLIKSDMTVDSGFVYYVAGGDLKRVASDGSAPPVFIASVGMDHDQGHSVFAVTGSDVIFCDPVGGIYRTPTTGGSLQDVAIAPSPLIGCDGVAVSSDQVFWSTHDGDDADQGYVLSAPLTSGGQAVGEVIATVGTPQGLRYHDGALYYLAGPDVLTKLDPATSVETALVPDVSFYANLAFDSAGPSLIVQQGQYRLLKVSP